MLGWCMILMAGFSRLSAKTNAIAGVAIIVLHNALGGVFGKLGPLGTILYEGWILPFGESGVSLTVLYSIIPWIGVMMAGYGLGPVMTRPADDRNRLLIRLGVAAIIAFVVLRALDVYGDPQHWRGNPENRLPPVLAFFNTTKYPASLLFLLMTLGPTLVLLGYADRFKGRVAQWLIVFGRVPFFYYVLHIPLIHIAACLVSVVRAGHVDPWLIGNHPGSSGTVPPGYRWSLPLLYGVWLACVWALYYPCRWFAGIRARRGNVWLSYL